MDADTLGKLFELFAKLGDQGQTAFIYWLAIKNGAAVISALIAGGTIITVVLLITKAIARSSQNEACLRDLGKILNVSIHWEPGASERLALLRAAEKLAAKR